MARMGHGWWAGGHRGHHQQVPHRLSCASRMGQKRLMARLPSRGEGTWTVTSRGWEGTVPGHKDQDGRIGPSSSRRAPCGSGMAQLSRDHVCEVGKAFTRPREVLCTQAP